MLLKVKPTLNHHRGMSLLWLTALADTVAGQ
jgi:hypothetical protein